MLDPALIVVGLRAEDAASAITQLANRFLAQSYVKETYLPAVLAREEVFPTGLPTEDVQVALPHTDTIHCLKPGLAVGILEKPVQFREMGSTTGTVMAKIVFLLSITDPADQVKWLAKLTDAFQTPGFLRDLSGASSPEQAYELMVARLGNE